jgi:hypothetical protein
VTGTALRAGASLSLLKLPVIEARPGAAAAHPISPSLLAWTLDILVP